MLNLLKLEKNKYNLYKYDKSISQIKKGDDVNVNRITPHSTKTWFNSIYTYDKKTMNSIMHLDKMVNNVIKMYFNLNSNLNLNKKFIRRRLKEYHLSDKRIY